MAEKLGKLEQLLGYKFQDLKLLERSLTHRSWAYEKVPSGEEEEIRELQNESLEFVGDAVLGLAIAEQLYLRHPKSSEGDLTLMKHHLVSTDTLAKLAKSLGLGEYMRVGRGEEKTGGRRKQALLADILEAVIGAIFFDSGYVPARSFINRIFAEDLSRATPRNSIDYKTLLQETLQADKLSAPTYGVVKTEGPPHDRIFFVEAVWENGRVTAKGSSIKAAEMKAASLVLKKLEKSRNGKKKTKSAKKQ
ncbi:MAG: ribonuclease III [Pyrinomonadaceae bacterium]